MSSTARQPKRLETAHHIRRKKTAAAALRLNLTISPQWIAASWDILMRIYIQKMRITMPHTSLRCKLLRSPSEYNYVTQRRYGSSPGFGFRMSSQIGSGCWDLGASRSLILIKFASRSWERRSFRLQGKTSL